MPSAPRANTPTLDAFAGVGRQLQLKARWVQIDADVLRTAFPAWNTAGASSHVASFDELRALEILRAAGTASVTEQQINAVNNQTANLSFAPFSFTFIKQPELTQKGPIDDMVIPRENSALTPHIPNLATPESKLPQMAPMPNLGSKEYSQLPAPDPEKRERVSRELAELMGYKFKIRPTLIGQQIVLELQSLNSASNIAAKARADQGETVVFSLPNILMLQGASKIRHTFLLVTPTLATPRSPLDIPTIPTP